jgi:leader peptidase (prepilin peptidase)/N-methyltransferase
MIQTDTVMMILVGVAGLMIGSFLNVLIARYKELETVVYTRSHCAKCKKIIAWYDLVPLLSFVLLKARCRYCNETISWQYPVVELITALVMVNLFLFYGLSSLFFVYVVIFSLLIVIARIDMIDGVVPDAFMLPAILFGLVAAFLPSNHQSIQPFWGVAVAGGSLTAIVLLSRERWMGAGDIGLGILLGLLAGFLGSLVGLVVAFVGGSIVGLLMIAIRQKTLKQAIPFGPFLVIAIYVSANYGNEIANWYLTTIHFY